MSKTVFGKKERGVKIEGDLQRWLNRLKCKTVMDNPIVSVWENIYKISPNAKVILTVRDFESWYTMQKKVQSL